MVPLLRWILPAFIATTILAQGASPPSPTPKTSFTLAFWNIQWFPGRRPNATRREELRQIQSVHGDIAKIDADIIGMEEVRDFRHVGVAVESLPGFKVDVCSNFLPREGQNVAQQVAIASRLQPVSAWAEMWRSGDRVVPPRGFAFAAYEIAPKQLVLIYALHLKSNRGSLREDIAMREESIRQFTTHMRAMKKIYGKLGSIAWIVGGDFNTSPENPKLTGEKTMPQIRAEGLSWVWENVPFAKRYTRLPDRLYPPACDDHIFYGGVTLQHASVLNTSPQSSDHRAIKATFTY